MSIYICKCAFTYFGLTREAGLSVMVMMMKSKLSS